MQGEGRRPLIVAPRIEISRDGLMLYTVKRKMSASDIMAQPLEREFNYYLQHQDDLVAKYNGKFVVIKDDKVLGAYDNELEAVEKTSKDHKLGTFLVQKCEPGTESYTQTFHSRVAFA